MIFLGVRSQPTGSRLNIFNLSWKYGILTEAIIETGYGKTVLKVGKWDMIFFASHAEGAPMNPNYERQFFPYIWKKKIELLTRTPIRYISKIIIALHFFLFYPNSK